MKVSIDFESRAVVDIWDSGAWVYSRHPDTKVLCIAFAVDDEPVEIITFPELEEARLKPGAAFSSLGLSRLKALASRSDVTFHAFNAFFEQSLWLNIMVPQFWMPEIPIKRWRCTQSKSNAFGLPSSLEKAALALGISEHKDSAGAQIMLKVARPAKPKKGDAEGLIRWNEDLGDFERLYEYCKQDVRVEQAIDKALPNLIPIEQEIWFLDQLINMRGVYTDHEFVKCVRGLLAQHNARLNKELSALTGGKVSRGTEVAGMLSYLREQGVELENLNKKTVSDLISAGKLDEHCLRVLRYRVELGKSSNAKYEKLATATDTDGVVRDCYLYHQASTGRWGGQLVQLQNLPVNRDKIDENDAIHSIKTCDYPTIQLLYGGGINKIASACVRGVFVPRGRKFLVVDYSAIEARGVMWLAGEERGIQEFRAADRGEGPEIYVRMAQRIFTNPKLTKADKDQRNVGKTTILGCGFGMGVERFYNTCIAWGVKGVDEDTAQTCVSLYRNTYPKVRDFWYSTERAAIEAVNFPGRAVTCGRTVWVYNKARNYLFCKLPSGRFLAYQAPEIGEGKYCPSLSTMGVNGLTKQWEREETYGGKLVENLTQAVARDLMAQAMLRVEKAGLPIAMHTHDEIVAEGHAEQLDDMIKIMCELPEWAEGFPLAAEGFVTERYTKK